MYAGITFFLQMPCGHLDCSLVEKEAVEDESSNEMKVEIGTECWLCQQPTNIEELVTLTYEETDKFLETCQSPLKEAYGQLLRCALNELNNQEAAGE